MRRPARVSVKELLAAEARAARRRKTIAAILFLVLLSMDLWLILR